MRHASSNVNSAKVLWATLLACCLQAGLMLVAADKANSRTLDDNPQIDSDDESKRDNDGWGDMHGGWGEKRSIPSRGEQETSSSIPVVDNRSWKFPQMDSDGESNRGGDGWGDLPHGGWGGKRSIPSRVEQKTLSSIPVVDNRSWKYLQMNSDDESTRDGPGWGDLPHGGWGGKRSIPSRVEHKTYSSIPIVENRSWKMLEMDDESNRGGGGWGDLPHGGWGGMRSIPSRVEQKTLSSIPIVENRSWKMLEMDDESNRGGDGWGDLPHGGWGRKRSIPSRVEQKTLSSIPVVDNRSWKYLQMDSDDESTRSGPGWGDLPHGGWGGKRSIPSIPIIVKRSWNNFQGGWGKRTPYDEDEAIQEISQRLEQDKRSIPVESENNEFIVHDKNKRNWNKFTDGWGKRSKWDNFKGTWGKREPAWSNLKGIWGKRSESLN